MDQIGNEEQKKKNRMGTGAIIFFILFAIICDLIGLIPIAKDIMGPIFWGAFFIYSGLSGMGWFGNWSRVAAMGIDLVASLIPAIQEFPELTLGIVVVIIMIRFEDVTGKSIIKPLQAGISAEGALNADGKRLPPPKQPLYSDGERLPQGQATQISAKQIKEEQKKANLLDLKNRNKKIIDSLNPEDVTALQGYAKDQFRNISEEEQPQRLNIPTHKLDTIHLKIEQLQNLAKIDKLKPGQQTELYKLIAEYNAIDKEVRAEYEKNSTRFGNNDFHQNDDAALAA